MSPARRDRIAFVTSAIPEAEQAREALVRRYGDVAPAMRTSSSLSAATD